MRPRHILMTLDAVGGVWRYSVDLARALNEESVRVLLVCLGPAPSAEKMAEAATLPATCLACLDEPLDWLVADPRSLDAVPARIEELAERHDVDLLHLSLPSQAFGLRTRRPVAVVSHSCVVTWWQAVRGTPLPEAWRWQFERNKGGLERADVAIAPTRSHAEALTRAYGPVGGLRVVPNAVSAQAHHGDEPGEEPFVFAAARWWDEGKNAALLDRAAAEISWPLRTAGARQGDNGQTFAFRHAEWTGELSPAETRALMAKAGIFVSPSLYEPFGLAVLEAAQAGTALVLADIASYRELWDGAAVFADPRDPRAFAQAIEGLAQDDAARAGWAAKAKARARDFTPARQLEALFSAYEPAWRRSPAALEPDLAEQ